ncbi:uncharacterized protein LOC117101932 [Anneissia japonica]|uniref:uncharacterized protein LOC117101932 n=1 Tax=Anneissia japonica TaxID=1529436 RepID=UPI00142585C3|nr:uncharacterized protein LOC117101932 [Anneissia japonica]
MATADEVKFMELVQQYPCLYDKGCTHYKNKTTRQNAWKAIAEELGDPNAEILVKKYKAIRDKFVKHLTKKNPSGSGNDFLIEERYEYLRWLLPHTAISRKSTGNYHANTAGDSPPDALTILQELDEGTTQVAEELDTDVGTTQVVEDLDIDVCTTQSFEDLGTDCSLVDTPTSSSSTGKRIITPPGQSRGKKMKKTKDNITSEEQQDIDKVMIGALKKISSEKDKASFIGEYIAVELRELPKPQQGLAILRMIQKMEEIKEELGVI